MADDRGKHKSGDKSSYQKLLKSCCSFFLLLLVFLFDVCLLELRSVGITLHLPLAVLVLLELALLEELGEEVLGLEGLLGVGLLELEPVVELPDLPLVGLSLPFFARVRLLDLVELGRGPPPLRAYLEEVDALAVRC